MALKTNIEKNFQQCGSFLDRKSCESTPKCLWNKDKCIESIELDPKLTPITSTTELPSKKKRTRPKPFIKDLDPFGSKGTRPPAPKPSLAPPRPSIDSQQRDDMIQSISFIEGWNWFSINVQSDDMSINNVLSSLTPTAGDFINSQEDGTATYYDDGGWYGGLVTIEIGKGYKIKLDNSGILTFTGSPVDPASTPIELGAGWNWIGYLPQESLDINDALSNLPNPTFSSNQEDTYSFIKSRDASSRYYEDNGGVWYGGLETLGPGQSYMLRVKDAQTFYYPYTCEDESACNTGANSACEYPDTGFDCDGNPLEPVSACTDPIACNYNAVATSDDGSCMYASSYYTNQCGCVADDDDDGICDAWEDGYSGVTDTCIEADGGGFVCWDNSCVVTQDQCSQCVNDPNQEIEDWFSEAASCNAGNGYCYCNYFINTVLGATEDSCNSTFADSFVWTLCPTFCQPILANFDCPGTVEVNPFTCDNPNAPLFCGVGCAPGFGYSCHNCLVQQANQCYSIKMMDDNRNWFVENNVQKRFEDGTLIIAGYDSYDPETFAGNWNTAALTSTAAYVDTGYGKIYNLYAINVKQDESEYQKNVCPPGWHVASFDEWQILIELYGGHAAAADALQHPSFGSSSNSSGFNITADGIVNINTQGYWEWQLSGTYGEFWSGIPYDHVLGIGYQFDGVGSINVEVSMDNAMYGVGRYVRCIEHAPGWPPTSISAQPWYYSKEENKWMGWIPAAACALAGDDICQEFVPNSYSGTPEEWKAMIAGLPEDWKRNKEDFFANRTTRDHPGDDADWPYSDYTTLYACHDHPTKFTDVAIGPYYMDTINVGEMPYGCWRQTYSPRYDEVWADWGDIGCCDSIFNAYSPSFIWNLGLQDCHVLDGYYNYICGGCNCSYTRNGFADDAELLGIYPHNKDDCDANSNTDCRVELLGPSCPDFMCVGGEYHNFYCDDGNHPENVGNGVSPEVCEGGGGIGCFNGSGCSWAHKYNLGINPDNWAVHGFTQGEEHWSRAGWNSFDRSCCPGCSQFVDDYSCIGWKDDLYQSDSFIDWSERFNYSQVQKLEGEPGPDWYAGGEPETWEEYCVGICEHYTDHDREFGLDFGWGQASACAVTPILQLCKNLNESECGTWDVTQHMSDYADIDGHPWYGYDDDALTASQKAFNPASHPNAGEVVSAGQSIQCSEEPYNCWTLNTTCQCVDGFICNVFNAPSCNGCCNAGHGGIQFWGETPPDSCSDYCVEGACAPNGTCTSFPLTVEDVMVADPSINGLCWAPLPGSEDYGITSGGCCGWSKSLNSCVYKGCEAHHECAGRCLNTVQHNIDHGIEGGSFCVDNCQTDNSLCVPDPDASGGCVGGKYSGGTCICPGWGEEDASTQEECDIACGGSGTFVQEDPYPTCDGRLDCSGICNGDSVLDACNICSCPFGGVSALAVGVDGAPGVCATGWYNEDSGDGCCVIQNYNAQDNGCGCDIIASFPDGGMGITEHRWDSDGDGIPASTDDVGWFCELGLEPNSTLSSKSCTVCGVADGLWQFYESLDANDYSDFDYLIYAKYCTIENCTEFAWGSNEASSSANCLADSQCGETTQHLCCSPCSAVSPFVGDVEVGLPGWCPIPPDGDDEGTEPDWDPYSPCPCDVDSVVRPVWAKHGANAAACNTPDENGLVCCGCLVSTSYNNCAYEDFCDNCIDGTLDGCTTHPSGGDCDGATAFSHGSLAGVHAPGGCTYEASDGIYYDFNSNECYLSGCGEECCSWTGADCKVIKGYYQDLDGDQIGAGGVQSYCETDAEIITKPCDGFGNSAWCLASDAGSCCDWGVNYTADDDGDHGTPTGIGDGVTYAEDQDCWCPERNYLLEASADPALILNGPCYDCMGVCRCSVATGVCYRFQSGEFIYNNNCTGIEPGCAYIDTNNSEPYCGGTDATTTPQWNCIGGTSPNTDCIQGCDTVWYRVTDVNVLSYSSGCTTCGGAVIDDCGYCPNTDAVALGGSLNYDCSISGGQYLDCFNLDACPDYTAGCAIGTKCYCGTGAGDVSAGVIVTGCGECGGSIPSAGRACNVLGTDSATCSGAYGDDSQTDGDWCGTGHYCDIADPYYGNVSFSPYLGFDGGACQQYDCTGTCDGYAECDECGVCTGPNTSGCSIAHNSNLPSELNGGTCFTGADAVDYGAFATAGVCCRNYLDKGCGCTQNPSILHYYDKDGDGQPGAHSNYGEDDGWPDVSPQLFCDIYYHHTTHSDVSTGWSDGNPIIACDVPEGWCPGPFGYVGDMSYCDTSSHCWDHYDIGDGNLRYSDYCPCYTTNSQGNHETCDPKYGSDSQTTLTTCCGCTENAIDYGICPTKDLCEVCRVSGDTDECVIFVPGGEDNCPQYDCAGECTCFTCKCGDTTLHNYNSTTCDECGGEYQVDGEWCNVNVITYYHDEDLDGLGGPYAQWLIDNGGLTVADCCETYDVDAGGLPASPVGSIGCKLDICEAFTEAVGTMVESCSDLWAGCNSNIYDPHALAKCRPTDAGGTNLREDLPGACDNVTGCTFDACGCGIISTGADGLTWTGPDNYTGDHLNVACGWTLGYPAGHVDYISTLGIVGQKGLTESTHSPANHHLVLFNIDNLTTDAGCGLYDPCGIPVGGDGGGAPCTKDCNDYWGHSTPAYYNQGWVSVDAYGVITSEDCKCVEGDTGLGAQEGLDCLDGCIPSDCGVGAARNGVLGCAAVDECGVCSGGNPNHPSYNAWNSDQDCEGGCFGSASLGTVGKCDGVCLGGTTGRSCQPDCRCDACDTNTMSDSWWYVQGSTEADEQPGYQPDGCDECRGCQADGFACGFNDDATYPATWNSTDLGCGCNIAASYGPHYWCHDWDGDGCPEHPDDPAGTHVTAMVCNLSKFTSDLNGAVTCPLDTGCLNLFLNEIQEWADDSLSSTFTKKCGDVTYGHGAYCFCNEDGAGDTATMWDTATHIGITTDEYSITNCGGGWDIDSNGTFFGQCSHNYFNCLSSGDGIEGCGDQAAGDLIDECGVCNGPGINIPDPTGNNCGAAGPTTTSCNCTGDCVDYCTVCDGNNTLCCTNGIMTSTVCNCQNSSGNTGNCGTLATCFGDGGDYNMGWCGDMCGSAIDSCGICGGTDLQLYDPDGDGDFNVSCPCNGDASGSILISNTGYSECTATCLYGESDPGCCSTGGGCPAEGDIGVASYQTCCNNCSTSVLFGCNPSYPGGTGGDLDNLLCNGKLIDDCGFCDGAAGDDGGSPQRRDIASYTIGGNNLCPVDLSETTYCCTSVGTIDALTTNGGFAYQLCSSVTQCTAGGAAPDCLEASTVYSCGCSQAAGGTCPNGDMWDSGGLDCSSICGGNDCADVCGVCEGSGFAMTCACQNDLYTVGGICIDGGCGDSSCGCNCVCCDCSDVEHEWYCYDDDGDGVGAWNMSWWCPAIYDAGTQCGYDDGWCLCNGVFDADDDVPCAGNNVDCEATCGGLYGNADYVTEDTCATYNPENPQIQTIVSCIVGHDQCGYCRGSAVKLSGGGGISTCDKDNIGATNCHLNEIWAWDASPTGCGGGGCAGKQCGCDVDAPSGENNGFGVTIQDETCAAKDWTCPGYPIFDECGCCGASGEGNGIAFDVDSNPYAECACGGDGACGDHIQKDCAGNCPSDGGYVATVMDDCGCCGGDQFCPSDACSGDACCGHTGEFNDPTDEYTSDDCTGDYTTDCGGQGVNTNASCVGFTVDCDGTCNGAKENYTCGDGESDGDCWTNSNVNTGTICATENPCYSYEASPCKCCDYDCDCTWTGAEFSNDGGVGGACKTDATAHFVDDCGVCRSPAAQDSSPAILADCGCSTTVGEFEDYQCAQVETAGPGSAPGMGPMGCGTAGGAGVNYCWNGSIGGGVCDSDGDGIADNNCLGYWFDICTDQPNECGYCAGGNEGKTTFWAEGKCAAGNCCKSFGSQPNPAGGDFVHSKIRSGLCTSGDCASDEAFGEYVDPTSGTCTIHADCYYVDVIGNWVSCDDEDPCNTESNSPTCNDAGSIATGSCTSTQWECCCDEANDCAGKCPDRSDYITMTDQDCGCCVPSACGYSDCVTDTAVTGGCATEDYCAIETPDASNICTQPNHCGACGGTTYETTPSNCSQQTNCCSEWGDFDHDWEVCAGVTCAQPVPDCPAGFCECTTGITDCVGNCDGSASVDMCGECQGGCTTCWCDTNNVPGANCNGTTINDNAYCPETGCECDSTGGTACTWSYIPNDCYEQLCGGTEDRLGPFCHIEWGTHDLIGNEDWYAEHYGGCNTACWDSEAGATKVGCSKGCHDFASDIGGMGSHADNLVGTACQYPWASCETEECYAGCECPQGQIRDCSADACEVQMMGPMMGICAHPETLFGYLYGVDLSCWCPRCKYNEYDAYGACSDGGAEDCGQHGMCCPGEYSPGEWGAMEMSYNWWGDGSDGSGGMGAMTTVCNAARSGTSGTSGASRRFATKFADLQIGMGLVDEGITSMSGATTDSPRVPPNSCVPGGAKVRCPDGNCTLWTMKWWNGKKHMRLYYVEGFDDPSADLRLDENVEIICGSNYRGGEYTIGWGTNTGIH